MVAGSSWILLFPSDIVDIHNIREGIEVTYHCFRNHEGIWHSG